MSTPSAQDFPLAEAPPAAKKDLLAAKKDLRSRLRAERKARAAENLSDCETRMSAHIMDVIGELPPGDIAVYVSMPSEPPTGQLRRELKARGFRPLIPRVNGSDLQWASDTDVTEWDTNVFGTQEPTNEFVEDQLHALKKCVAIIVPAHAVDPQGMRLGQGKGFYDRALEFTRAAESKPLLISLTFDSEYLQEVPHESHDIPVDVSVTESTVRWFHTPD